MRRQDKSRREPRTLAQQLQPDTIVCMACEQIKPASGSRLFGVWDVCADCCADVEKRIKRIKRIKSSKDSA